MITDNCWSKRGAGALLRPKTSLYGQIVHRAFEALKERAFEKGYAPPGVLAVVESVLRTGVSLPLTSATQRMRAELGLPPFAPQGLEELKAIARNAGLEEILQKLKTKQPKEHGT